MKRLSVTHLCQYYLLLALIAVAVLSPMPYSILASAWFVVMLLVTLRVVPVRFSILVMMVTIFLIPFVFEPVFNYLSFDVTLPFSVAQLLAVIAASPAIYTLDNALKQNAESITPSRNSRTKGPTYITAALAVSITIPMLISLVLRQNLLFYTCLLLALYLVTVSVLVHLSVPGQPLFTATIKKRIIAGTAAHLTLSVSSKARVKLRCHLIPVDSWVNITPPELTIGSTEIALDLSFTAPLSGPLHLQVHVSAIDNRGLIQVHHNIQPVELHVIPKARYAEWMAKKYLQQSGAGISVDTSTLLNSLPIAKRGVEYLSSRLFQFGDQIKDTDWKHTLKLKQRMIKEYSSVSKQPAIIGVNLSVSNAEEADKLAFNLLTTAVTLARQGIPTALTAYHNNGVVLTTTLSDPDTIVKQALLLIKEIRSSQLPQRYLQPVSMKRLRQNIRHLNQAMSEPAQRLLHILNLEHKAITQAATKHTATIALSRATRQVMPPATIILASQKEFIADTLPVITDKLSRQGFTVFEMPQSDRPSPNSTPAALTRLIKVRSHG